MDGAWTLLPGQTHCFSQRKQQTNCWAIIHSAPPSFSYWKGHQFGDQKISHETLSVFHQILERSQNYLFYFQKICTLRPALFLLGCFTFLFPPQLLFFKSIYCMFFLAHSHFPFFIISSLWSSVSFFFFSVMAALPVVLLWGPEFPLANETRAAYLPCFCNPAVSFLKYKLIFIQWSSCAGSDPLRGDCILWQQVGGKK